jgi:hypothetical protein
MNLSPEEFETAIAEMGFVSPEGTARQYYWSPCWEDQNISAAELRERGILAAYQKPIDDVLVHLDMRSTRDQRRVYRYEVQYHNIILLEKGSITEYTENFCIRPKSEGYAPLLDLVARYKAKARSAYDEIVGE